MSDVFQALAAPARRALLDELQQRDGQTLFELCTRLTMTRGLPMSRQAISQHLDVLEAAGLVITRREGRCKFHYLDTRPLKKILSRWRAGDRKERREADLAARRPSERRRRTEQQRRSKRS